MSIEMRNALLRDAERLLRTRGYADFSYADLATTAGISKASVHHYFPTKAALAEVLLREYLQRFEAALEQIERACGSLAERLAAYAALFRAGFDDGMMPLCGALAAERAALPDTLQQQVSVFFGIHLGWLERVLRAAAQRGELPPGIGIDRAALRLLSAIEGGSLTAWALQDSSLVVQAFEDVAATLQHSPKGKRRRRA